MSTEVCHVSISSIEFDKVYRILRKRESLGYSSADLSFMLGFDLHKVDRIEDPTHTLRYTTKDTNYLMQIFDCDLSELMAGKIDQPFVKVMVEVSTYGSVKQLKIYLEKPDKVYEPFAQLPSTNLVVPPNDYASAADIQEYVTSLFEANYFLEGKTSLEVYKKCLEHFGKAVTAADLFLAVSFYTKKRKAPRLIKLKNKSRRHIYLNDPA